MAVAYTIAINDVRVHIQNDIPDVVKEVDVNMTGTENGCSFSLPFTVTMPPADPNSFTPFANLTEAQVVEWVESQTVSIEPYKRHIALVLEKMVEQSLLEKKTPPWAPPAPPTPTPAPVAEA